ncbi:AraC family transcriptional regulator [Enterovirga sp. CN4-39]|uniref:AraC family transcriptional regulator n=1 Tax=Enterovirga sp. CN4-39 TaxID=3400910 RepID=UPI003C08CA78
MRNPASEARDVFRRRFAGPIESLHARLETWSYGRHAHVDYAVGITEAGSQTFTCRGVRHRTRPGSVILFNPFELHDGHATTSAGVLYRMLYIPVAEMREAVGDAAGIASPEPAFRVPSPDDPGLFASIRRLAEASESGDGFLVEESLVLLAGRLAELPARERRTRSAVVDLQRICDRLRAEPASQLRVSDLAHQAGIGRFELIRAFQRRFGMPPSAWIRTVRLEAAKALLAKGLAPASVAAETGFADQAHLTRWFRRSYGAPPAAFSRAAIRPPEAD